MALSLASGKKSQGERGGRGAGKDEFHRRGGNVSTSPPVRCLVLRMAYTMPGTIKKIFPTQSFPSGFSKREFVVTSKEDRFPQDVKFDCLKEKEEILKSFKEGDEVTVHFDIRGREYNGRYFVDLNAWKLEQGAPAASAGAAPVEPEDTTDYGAESGDDIPF